MEKVLVKKRFFALAKVCIFTFITSNWTITTELAAAKSFNAYDNYAMDNYGNSWGIQEYLPAGTEISQLKNSNLNYSKNIQISEYSKRGIYVEFTCINSSDKPEKIVIPLIMYKGFMYKE